jgi:flagellum-specific ATP synthase
MNEPIADSVRGILDGHIVLSRKMAAKNHFPAIDIQNSISRLMNSIVSKDHNLIAGQLKENLAIYTNSEDLINVGAYIKGSNPIIDKAINLNTGINDFLKQNTNDSFTFEQTTAILKDLID